MIFAPRKKKVILFSKLTFLFGLITPTILITTISCSTTNVASANEPVVNEPPKQPPTTAKPPTTSTPLPPITELPPVSGPNKPTLPKPLPQNQQLWQTSSINAFTNLQAKIVKNGLERQINNQEYQTDLLKQYGENFKYPAWNYNYEINKEANRWQVIDNNKIDASTLVFEERVPDYLNSKGQKVKYSDPGFILAEIAKKQLKKHPAAKGWYQADVSEQTKAVNKFFSIPSQVLGPTALGLYIPAGEVATLEFSAKTLKQMSEQKINNFRVVLNSSFWDNKEPKDSGRISNRYPFVKTDFNVDLKTLIANQGKFEFGSPFGGTISIKINSRLKVDDANPFYEVYDNFDFNVSGAVEMLSYFHTVTSEQDWKDQVQKVLNGQISAPGLALDFAFGSANISATAPNQFAYKNVQEILFPFEILDKWTAFLFSSEFFGSRDKNHNVKKLDFEFCDDIWGSAGAWGGGDALYSPLSWAKNAFFSGDSEWTIKRNWGVFHEINHNFQQNSALFNRRTHPETNQVTMVNLSLLSDSGRWRNLYNPAADFTTSGWTRLQNLFSTIQHIIKNNYVQNTEEKNKSEYEMQNILLYTLGTFNFTDYVRHDMATNPGTGGFNEIVELSNYFKLNFWPAFKSFSSWWTDGWPVDEAAATEAQRSQINQLNQNYKAFDFVGNVFATGAFLYNQATDQYDYTNDMQAPIDIPAGKPFSFDFKQGINSVNPNFQWDELNFDQNSKLGGSLHLASDNNKKLVYIPPKDLNTIGQIDEFKVSITPANFEGKPTNYVDEYIWKIKVRLVANLPVVTMYKEPVVEQKYNNKDFYKEFAYLKNEANFAFQTTSDPRLGLLADQEPTNLNRWQRTRISFNFIAPETGTYDFQVKSNSWLFIDTNKKTASEQPWWVATSVPKNNWLKTSQLSLQKGEAVLFDVYLTNKWLVTRFEMQAVVNNQTYDAFAHAVLPWIKQLTNQPQTFLDPKYAYKPRVLNFNDFQTSLFGLSAARNLPVIKKTTDQQTNYTFKAQDPADAKIDHKLAQKDNIFFEHWAKNANLPYKMNFQVNFAQSQKIGAIIFHHRTNNWGEARPTQMKISDQNGNVLLEGPYGYQFNDRRSAASRINFDKIYDIKQLNFEFINEKIVNTKNKRSAIIFDGIEFASQQFSQVNKVISVQDPAIKIHGNDWKLVTNDPAINLSAINGVALKNTKEQQYLEFNIFAQGFDIVGQKGPENGRFDLFINDQFVTTVDTTSSTKLHNQILYSYAGALDRNGQGLKVQIVTKENKDLFINYLQTYGAEVYVEPVAK